MAAATLEAFMLGKLLNVVDEKLSDKTVGVLHRLWQGRVLFLPEVMTPENCTDLQARIGKMEKDVGRPIILICDSGGGHLTAGMDLADVVQACKVPVVTLVFEGCGSAAVRVFAAGRLRMMHRKALLVTHGPRYMIHDTTLEKGAAYYGMLNNPLAQGYKVGMMRLIRQARRHLEALAGQTLPDFLFREDNTFLPPLQAKALGLADGVFLHPPVEVWWKARKLEVRKGSLVTA